MKTRIICFYFTGGKVKTQQDWFVWMDAFLLSCKYNAQFDWLIFSDFEIPKSYPSNVRFVRFSIEDFNALASSKLSLNINTKNNKPRESLKSNKHHKVGDFRPSFGIIFEDYLKGYNWWGHMDLDIILGSIDSFIKPTDFENFEIISSRKNKLTGHFTLYKNIKKINELFKLINRYEGPFGNPNDPQALPCRGTYQHLFSLPDNQRILELNMNLILRNNPDLVKTKLDKYLVNFNHDEVVRRESANRGKPIRQRVNALKVSKADSPWVWRKGSLLWKDKHEVMYIHFPNYAKYTLKYISFSYDDDPDAFILTPDSILSL